MSKLNITLVGNAKDLDIVMSMFKLIQYIDNYAKKSGSLWRYCREESEDDLRDSESSRFNSRFKNNFYHSDNVGTVKIETVGPLKYLTNVWRTLKMSLINCELNLTLSWSVNCVICEVICCVIFSEQKFL